MKFSWNDFNSANCIQNRTVKSALWRQKNNRRWLLVLPTNAKAAQAPHITRQEPTRNLKMLSGLSLEKDTCQRRLLEKLRCQPVIVIIFGKFTNIMNKLNHLKRKIDRNIFDYVHTLFGWFPPIKTFANS